MSVGGFARACHPGPTAVMTVLISAVGWSLGWRSWALAGLALCVLVGQLSVGWSNDAHDASVDVAAGRRGKPVVDGQVSARVLWISASIALIGSVLLSWWLAGWWGGSFHVLALVMAWLYNVRLSRTGWSWVPYAVAFAAIPPFLSYGAGSGAPPLWLLAVFPLIGVSAHLANALPDVALDAEEGLGGAAVRLGVQRAATLCWLLLAGASILLATQALGTKWWLALIVLCALVGAGLYARFATSRSALFHALMGAVAVDAVALVLLGI